MIASQANRFTLGARLVHFLATVPLTQRLLQLLHYFLVFAINSTYYVFSSIAALFLCPLPSISITKMRAH
ncbi:hypothetical protein THF1C08_200057 [Vibrio jasicida]|uniref:DUF3265 domain-containing protein n=1 Tax=Vibrio jasicida TaxID=766224 RepID=A0AAU9QLM9_9VIBR|nr:hypothetical protein THF1C08_200057 [Vibrio jasicida]CAH1589539.1 hypothetical protein THF1A12_210056 [Vibrio jasicida]